MAHLYMPVSISLKDRNCLLVGGGEVALRKIETLLNYESNITVIAPEVIKRIRYLVDQGSIAWEKREYQLRDATSFGIVISASSDNRVNETVYNDCQNAKIPVNVVDNPRLCDFIFPAVLRRDSLSIAISTDGKAPFLSRHLRLILEDIFPDRWKRITKLAGKFRKIVRKRWPDDLNKRTKSFENFLTSDWEAKLQKEKNQELEMDKELARLVEDKLEQEVVQK